MKRQFYFDDVERDLLRTALSSWSAKAQDDAAIGICVKACRSFTVRRIDEMLERLKEPEPKQ